MGQFSSSKVDGTDEDCSNPEVQYLISISKGDACAFDEKTIEKFKSGGAETVGGYVVGGYDDLKEYDSTVSSKAKHNLIKKLASGISKALRVSPPKSNASSDELVAHLIKIIPNPRKGKSIIKDKTKQAKLCNDIADVINTNYKKNIIDKSLSPDGVCNQVAELVDALGAGLNQEYVAVAASVTRNLQNLTDLQEMLTRSYDKLYSEAMSSDDDKLKLSAEGIKAIHDLLLQETSRQIAILTNLTNTVVKETDRDIANLLAENKDFKGLVASLKAHLGSSAWGDKMGYMLSGVGGLGAITSAVQKALKTIGLKTSEYKNTHKLTDLMLKAHEKFENLPDNKVTKAYLEKYYAAVGVLRKHHGRHSQISKKINGGLDPLLNGGGDTYGEGYTGGRIKLAKRLKKQKVVRVALLNDFRSKIKIHMDRVYKAIFNTGRKLTSGNIPLNDDIYTFKVLLNDLSNVFTDGIEYALTGYYSDSNATRRREHFLGIVQGLLNSLHSLKSLDSGFRDIASNLESVVKLMDFYADKFHAYTSKSVPKTGAADTYSPDETRDSDMFDRVEPEKDQLEQSDTDKDSAYEKSGGGEFKATVSLNNARNTFNHYYNIAKFKKNLVTVSSELKGYNKNYTEVVGSAVGLKLNDIRTKTASALKTLSEVKDDERFGNNGSEWNVEYVKQLLQLQLSAKEDLYRVAQAVDEYLQKFTDSVAAGPEDVQQVSKLLSSVELISNWFSEKSGDSIASLYEIFPWKREGGDNVFNDELQKVVLENAKSSSGVVRTRLGGANSHYYEHVSAVVTGDKKLLPAKPSYSISPERSVLAHKFAKYTVEKVYVLKNIVSAFAYLGQKFGDQDLTRSTFLSPNEMYKCLCKYLYISAFTWLSPENNDKNTYYRTTMSYIEGSETKTDEGDIKPSIFKEEDEIFINVIKSMAAKVFTVTGLYNMMNFSSSGGLRNYALSPTRLVLGGKDGGVRGGLSHYSYSTPKIYEGAIELYARLPLLAEFYRSIFCYEEPCDSVNREGADKELLISMVPEVGSMWAGFITTIFDQPLNTNGVYTDNVLKHLIHEINEVYITYKNRGSKDITSSVISDFIAEINSRYGVMQRTEINQYRNDENERRRGINYGESAPDDDYDVLDEDNIGTGIAPSDRYTYAKPNQPKLETDYKLDDGVVEALRTFRRRIDKRIQDVLLKGQREGFDRDDYYENDVGLSAIPDFTRVISSTRASLGNSKDVDAQFKLVRGMMLGMDVQTQTNVEAAVMFHESVVAPLNILTAITNMLQTYVDETKKWDASALFSALRKFYDPDTPAAGEKVLLKEQFKDREAGDTTLDKRLDAIINNTMRNPTDKFVSGYMGLTGEISVEDIIKELRRDDKLKNTDGETKKVSHENFKWSDHVAYVNIKWEAVYKFMVNAVYSLTADTNNLCEVSVNGSRLTVNHTGLQVLCEGTLAKVRSNIDKFRGVIDTPTLTKYLGSESSTPGSILWVHDNLVSNLFGDYDGINGLKRAHLRVTNALQLVANVDPEDQSKHITYFDLRADTKYKRTSGWCVDGVLSEMTHYNPLTAASSTLSGINYHEEEQNNVIIDNFLTKPPIYETVDDKFSHLMQELNPQRTARSWPHPIYKKRIGMYLQENTGDAGFRGAGHTRNRLNLDGTLNNTPNNKSDTGAGLQVKFNEVMAQYLGQFWDPTSLKIYAGLIEGPANGPMSNAVFNARGHPDLVSPGMGEATLEAGIKKEVEDAAAIAGIDTKKDPEFKNQITAVSGLTGLAGDENVLGFETSTAKAERLNAGDPTEVLYASLAKALRTALNETNRSGVKVNIIQSIAEVPLRMKEDMKAQLPVFASQFKLIAKRAELLRSTLRLNVGVDRHNMSTTAKGVTAMRGVYGALDPSRERKHDDGVKWNRQWLDKITSCCDSMIITIRNVMTELNDAPLFFEVNEDSISNFKNRNGKLPVMPLSHLTLAVAPAKKHDSDADTGFVYRGDLGRTCTSGGDNRFMFNYGVRLVLNDDSSKPLLDHMPGVAEIVKRYNMVTPNNRQIPEKTYGDFVTDAVVLTRYAGQTRMYASLFGASRVIVEPTSKDTKSKELYSYQLRHGLGATVDLTTSTDCAASYGLIAEHVQDKYKPPVNVSRKSSMVYNLLDLNVSPINVHAMRREIPLANMYNYAYTFDSFITHIVQSSYDGDVDNNNKRIIKSDNRTTHEVLSALCKHPYIKVNGEIFYGKLENIVSGNSTLGFYGYPRFISDQLWSKALLQDTVIGEGYTATVFIKSGINSADNARRRDRINLRYGTINHDYGYGQGEFLKYNSKGTSVEKGANGRRRDIAEIGRSRFDTKFMRNMFFLSNVQRVMLYKINNELTEMKYPVATDMAIANKNLTDARDGQTHEDLYID